MEHLFAAVLAALCLAACASAGNVALKQHQGAHDTGGSAIGAGVPKLDQLYRQRKPDLALRPLQGHGDGRNFIPFANIFSSGANVESKELVTFFDKDGVVQNYSMEESKSQVKEGIIGQ